MVLLFICQTGNTCLNAYNINLRGQVADIYAGLPVFYRSFDKAFSRDFVSHYDLSKKESIHYEDLSDVAIHLARLGKYKKALELLIPLNKKYPNHYKIVANLGTLYELNGNIEQAYFYIKEGIRLNPESHAGSEWVHLAILQAKKQMRQNPGWILNHQVLRLNLTDTVSQFSEKHEAVLQKIRQISYQMEERIPFSPQPDLIVANIMNELGQLLATHISVVNAWTAYKIAEHYDPKNQLGIKGKAKKLLPLFKKYKTEIPNLAGHFPPQNKFWKVKRKKVNKVLSNTSKEPPWLVWLGVGLVFTIVISWVFKKWKNKSR